MNNRQRITQHCADLGLEVDVVEFYPQHDYCPSTGEVVCYGGFWSVYLVGRENPFTTNQDVYGRKDIDDEVTDLLNRLTQYTKEESE